MQRWAVSIGTAIVVSFIAGRLFGPVGLVVAAVLSLLVIAGRHDNDLGTCLPLAVLFVIACGILVMLMVMMGAMRGG